jgi:hypothetical protein
LLLLLLLLLIVALPPDVVDAIAVILSVALAAVPKNVLPLFTSLEIVRSEYKNAYHIDRRHYHQPSRIGTLLTHHNHTSKSISLVKLERHAVNSGSKAISLR